MLFLYSVSQGLFEEETAKSCKNHLILCGLMKGFSKAHFYACFLHVRLFYSSPTHCVSEGNGVVFFSSRVCVFGLAPAVFSELGFRRVCSIVSFIEALNAFEVSGCGFDPNEWSSNFKTGFFQRSG